MNQYKMKYNKMAAAILTALFMSLQLSGQSDALVSKAEQAMLRATKYMVEKVSKDPISVGQLKLNGDELMEELKMKPGPKIGAIL